MKRFLVKVVLFVVLPLPMLLIVEVASRRNSFAAKADYLRSHAHEIEVLLLGSSHTWRAVNPQFLNFFVAPFAHGGSAFNIDFLLFQKFRPSLGRLQAVVLEVSVHTLEEWRPDDWNKNHLFLVHYGLNNYGENTPPLRDRTLITADPRQHLKRLTGNLLGTGIGTTNEWGFATSPPESRFSNLDYDADLISKTSNDEWLQGRHEHEDLGAYDRNTRLLSRIVAACQRAQIKLILLSPPKYYLYNDHMPRGKRQRRQRALQSLVDDKTVLFWDDEEWQARRTEFFLNEDHLNPDGATAYTQELNGRLTQLLGSDSELNR